MRRNGYESTSGKIYSSSHHVPEEGCARNSMCSYLVFMVDHCSFITAERHRQRYTFAQSD